MEKISIAMTTFNDEKNIVEFLNGIMVQTKLPDEIVIADGGSKDKTVEVIREYTKTSPVRIEIISDGKRRNISQGFNDAIKKSINDWVLIMGTGNSYDDDFIEKLDKERKNSSSKVIYSSIIGVENTKFAHIFNQYFLRGNRKQDLDISNHGLLIHKSIFEQIGYFWENFVYAGEDLEYSIRIHKNNIECSYVKDAVAYWETPQTFKEYLKKMKVNSIADWQMFDKAGIWKNIIIQILGLAFYSALACVNLRFLLIIIPVLMVFSIKKKTINLVALIFGIVNRYVMVYYYIKNIKYSDEKYHI